MERINGIAVQLTSPILSSYHTYLLQQVQPSSKLDWLIDDSVLAIGPDTLTDANGNKAPETP